MLKGLKDKKAGKGDPKKDTKKDKQPKEETKKQEEEEEETIDALVEINYDEKEKSTAKNTKKGPAYKLEEKQIDTTNIKIEKKEEKKPLTSWVVEEENIGKMFHKDFDATKHETEFESLTDHKLNKELEVKAKKEAEENIAKPKVEEINGFKYAPLAPTGSTSVKVDVNEPILSVRKPAVDINSNSTSLPVTQINPPTFTNTKLNDFKPLEKSAQQQKEEEMELKMKQKGGDLILKGQTPPNAWLGGRKPVEQSVPLPEMKISGWAAKAMQEGDITPPTKFAPLERSVQERRFERQEQQFVFVSKKEQEERRKKREEEAAKNITKQ